jgi:hypothetical protein
VRLGLKGLLSHPQDHREALLDRYGDAGGHLRGGVPVEGTHGTAPLLADAAGGLMAHHLVDDPGRDAGVFQSQVTKVWRKSCAPRRSTAASSGSRAVGNARQRC